MQNYIKEYVPTTINLKTVKPNVWKVFFRNFLCIIGIVAGVVAVLVFLQLQVGLDVFLIPFETLNIAVDPKAILMQVIGIFSGGAAIFMLFNYLAVNNTRYEFYKEKIIIYEPSLWVFVTHREVSYKNFGRISYNYAGFTNKLLNSGEIIVDLNGMREPFIKLEVINDTEQVVAEMLRILKEYNAIQQMQFEENYKINNIMRKF